MDADFVPAAADPHHRKLPHPKMHDIAEHHAQEVSHGCFIITT